VDKLLDGYYTIRGWDLKTGTPTRKKLIELGLDKAANDIS
jgi:aldehyde:ferredoxin oxidoreductase